MDYPLRALSPILGRGSVLKAVNLGRLPATALLVASLMLPTFVSAQVTIDYTHGQNDATDYSTTAPNSPTTLSILSGTAIQSGVLDGTGSIIKDGAGTLILSSANTYTGTTTISQGTLNVASGSSINHPSSGLVVGLAIGDNGILRVQSGGSVTSASADIGNGDGSRGSADIAGTMNNSALTIGFLGTGNLIVRSGGSVSSSSGAQLSDGSLDIAGSLETVGFFLAGARSFSSSTITLRSGGSISTGGNVVLGWGLKSNVTANIAGTWNTDQDEFWIGFNGSDAIAKVTVENGGSINLLAMGGANYLRVDNSTLNITGSTAPGVINANYIDGTSNSTLNFNHTNSDYYVTSDGASTGDAVLIQNSIAVNHLGSGTTTLSGQNTYTGATTISGGTLKLAFSGGVPSNILPTGTALTLGGGTLQLSGTGTQTVNGLTTTADTGSRILLGSNETLTLGGLTAGNGSALNFNTVAGGASGATVGTGVVVLTGQTAGNAISPSFTVTDSTGFGLATVNGSNQIVRKTNTTLLPSDSANPGTDYRIDNNSNASDKPGSSSLIFTGTKTAHSITVDTTARNGVLTLASGVVLSTDTWNFGGNSSNTYGVANAAGAAAGTGLKSATSGGTMYLNNYNSEAVTFSSPILDNGASKVHVQGTGTTIFSGVNTYAGGTTIQGGRLEVASGGSITHNIADMIVGNTSGNNGTLNVKNGGSVSNNSGVIGSAAGSSGTADISGTWINTGQLVIGRDGTGSLTVQVGGSVSSQQAIVGDNQGSSGNADISGTWATATVLSVGLRGTGDLTVRNGGSVSANGYDYTNDSSSQLGYFTGSSGTADISGTWNNARGVAVGLSGTGALTVRNGGTVNTNISNVDPTLAVVSLARDAGSSGTLNIGAGGAAGVINAPTVNGGAGTATLNFNHTDTDYHFTTDGTSSGAAVLITGSTSVNHTGTGTTTLAGTNTYTGDTTISAGTLVLNGSAANSTFFLDGGTLGGSGSVGTLFVTSGSTISPGNSPGTMAVNGSVDFAGGANFLWEINSVGGSAGSDPGWDLFTAAGDINFTGANVTPITINLTSLTLGNAAGDVSNFDSAADYSFTFVTSATDIPDFSSSYFNLDTTAFTNSFDGAWSIAQSGNNLNLVYTAVPEPSAAILTGLGVLMFSLRRRRAV